MQLLFCYFN